MFWCFVSGHNCRYLFAWAKGGSHGSYYVGVETRLKLGLGGNMLETNIWGKCMKLRSTILWLNYKSTMTYTSTSLSTWHKIWNALFVPSARHWTYDFSPPVMSIICAPWQWISSIYVNTCTKLMSSMWWHATSLCQTCLVTNMLWLQSLYCVSHVYSLYVVGIVVLTIYWRVIVKYGSVKGNT